MPPNSRVRAAWWVVTVQLPWRGHAASLSRRDSTGSQPPPCCHPRPHTRACEHCIVASLFALLSLHMPGEWRLHIIGQGWIPPVQPLLA